MFFYIITHMFALWKKIHKIVGVMGGWLLTMSFMVSLYSNCFPCSTVNFLLSHSRYGYLMLYNPRRHKALRIWKDGLRLSQSPSFEMYIDNYRFKEDHPNVTVDFPIILFHWFRYIYCLCVILIDNNRWKVGEGMVTSSVF